jgi:hypothetical protein
MVPDTEFRRSDDVVDREIDPATGMLASPYCPSVETEVFVRGTEPNVVCTVHNAGTDELSPFWRSVPQVDGEPAMAQGGEPGQAPAAREPRRREKKSGLRKIFGWIFE